MLYKLVGKAVPWKVRNETSIAMVIVATTKRTTRKQTAVLYQTKNLINDIYHIA